MDESADGDGSVDESADGSVDESADGSVDESADGSVDASADGSMDVSVDGSVDESADGSVDDGPTAEPGTEDLEAEVDLDARREELEAEAANAEGAVRFSLLVEATACARGDDWSRLYSEVLNLDAGDVALYWRAGASPQAGTEQIQSIADALDRLSAEREDEPAVTAHRLVFGATHLEEARTVDFKLRDLVKKSGDPRWSTGRCSG